MARAVVVIVTGALIGILLAASVWLLRDKHSAPPIVIDDPRADATIVVAVSGAVASPGLQALGGEARMKDALDAAGGVLANADLSRINLAERLDDEQPVVVPTKVPPPARGSPASAGDAPGGSQYPAPALININTATAAELDTLPHIGPALALRIIAYREQHGPYRTVDELANVAGISTKTVDALRPLITVGP